MKSTHTKQNPDSLKNDHKWRKFKVLYITISLLILFVLASSLYFFNQRETCEVSTDMRWDNTTSSFTRPETSSLCSTALEREEGVSFWILLIPAGALGVGYLYLPRLYLYLNPPESRK